MHTVDFYLSKNKIMNCLGKWPELESAVFTEETTIHWIRWLHKAPKRAEDTAQG